MEALIQLANDLSGGDVALIERVRAAVADPPMTVEDVGFYGATLNPPDMNCFLFMITKLGNAGRILSSEDKYIIELIETFGKTIQLPQHIRSWFPKRLQWDGRDEGARRCV